MNDKYYTFEDPKAIEEQEGPSGPSCLFNKYVICAPDREKCKQCGWCPEVAKARHKAMGIYPSCYDLPTFGSYVGQILYVYESSQIYAYSWNGHSWIICKEEID